MHDLATTIESTRQVASRVLNAPTDRLLLLARSPDRVAPLTAALSQVPKPWASQVEVRDVAGSVLAILAASNSVPKLATSAQRDEIWRSALAGEGLSLPVYLLRREWEEVVQPARIATWEVYRQTRRVGQPVALSNEQRLEVWTVLSHVRRALDEQGLAELGDLVQVAVDQLRSIPAAPRYRAVVLESEMPLRAAERELLAMLCVDGSKGVIDTLVERPEPTKQPVDKHALRLRQRRALERFFAEPGVASTEQAAKKQAPWRAWLELEGPDRGGGLVMILEALPELPPSVEQLTVRWGDGEGVLLASNLRSGSTRTAVSPCVAGYRLEGAGVDDKLKARLEEVAIGGFSLERATVFAVRADGQAERTATAAVTSCGAVRVLVPPALDGPLPEPSWPLAGGWRAFSLSPAGMQGDAMSRLLNGLGLDASGVTLTVAWRGAPAHRRGSAPSGERYPCFLAGETPVLELTRDGPAVAFTVLLTAAQAERDLALPASEGAAHVALEGLAPGAYVVDIASYPGGPSERLFFAVESAPPRPPSAETVLLPDALRLPPAWRLDLRWEGLSRRWLGALHADETGRIEPAAIRRLVDPWAAAEPVADLVLDAGELGHARIPHDSCLSPEQTEAELLQLLQERGDALAVAQSDVDLTLLLLQPVAGLLGYQVGEPAPFPGGAALRLHTAMRDGDRVIRGPDALLVALRDGLAVGERPLAEVAARWRAALGAAGAQRGLFTTGLLWLVLERDRRQVPKVMSLGSPLHHEALLRFIEGGLA